MKAEERQKMCLNCDGRIPLDAQTCIYCGNDVSKQTAETPKSLFDQQSLQDSVSSLYTPPYSVKKPTTPESPTKQPIKNLKKEESFSASSALYPKTSYKEEQKIEAEKESQPVNSTVLSTVLSILALALGADLFIFGLIQKIFSQDGVLILRISGNHWFFYILFALPLLFFGYKFSKKLN